MLKLLINSLLLAHVNFVERTDCRVGYLFRNAVCEKHWLMNYFKKGTKTKIRFGVFSEGSITVPADSPVPTLPQKFCDL